MQVTAELMCPGLLRIYSPADAQPLVDRLKAEAADLRQAATLADRYRPLKLNEGGRLVLTKEVVALLGFALGEKPLLYTQPIPTGFSPTGIEIMSIEFRNSRLITSDRSLVDLE